MELALNPDLDATDIATTYASQGRVRIRGLMAEEGLRHFHGRLVERDDWRQLINIPGGIREFSREQRAAMSTDEIEMIDQEVQARACLGFQYRYEGLRIPAGGADTADTLQPVADLMASAPMLAFLEQIIDRTGVAFSEGQATAYANGDFLTCHDDHAAGRGRVAAFVLGMTPRWRPEWGGLLLFHADDDSQVDGHVPRFNTLDLFSVPQRHSVSTVSPAAPGRRLAITGWLSTAATENPV